MEGSSEQPQMTAGLDLGDKDSSLCLIYTQSGEIMEEGRSRTTPESLRRRFALELLQGLSALPRPAGDPRRLDDGRRGGGAPGERGRDGRPLPLGGENLNMQGALRHIVADLLGSVGVIAAALVIVLTGWSYAAPLISVLIGVLVLHSSWKLLRHSVNILLEGASPGIDAKEVGEKVVRVAGVEEVHDLHVWEITSGFPVLAAHVLVGREEDCHARRREIEKVLADDFGIEHTMLQVDYVGDHEAESGRLQITSRRRSRSAGR